MYFQIGNGTDTETTRTREVKSTPKTTDIMKELNNLENDLDKLRPLAEDFIKTNKNGKKTREKISAIVKRARLLNRTIATIVLINELETREKTETFIYSSVHYSYSDSDDDIYDSS
jgi:hypothetical protein